MKIDFLTKDDLQDLKAELLAEILEAIKQNNKPAKKDWLSEREAQQYLGVCKTTLWKYRRDGLIPFSQINRKTNYLRADLDDFLKRNSTKNTFND